MRSKSRLTAAYTFGKASGDSDGPGAFPSNSYNLQNEFGRMSFDVRHRFMLTGSIDTRWGIGFFPLIIASSGAPFNIITGLDNNGDSLFVDRQHAWIRRERLPRTRDHSRRNAFLHTNRV